MLFSWTAECEETNREAKVDKQNVVSCKCQSKKAKGNTPFVKSNIDNNLWQWYDSVSFVVMTWIWTEFCMKCIWYKFLSFLQNEVTSIGEDILLNDLLKEVEVWKYKIGSTNLSSRI